MTASVTTARSARKALPATPTAPAKRLRPSAPRVHAPDFGGIYRAAPLERIDLIKHGVGSLDVMALAQAMGTTQERLMATLGLPRTTVVRKAKSNALLSLEQGERVIGLAKLVGQVEAMVAQSGPMRDFNAAHWVNDWLDQPNPALGGRRPAELMDTVAGQEFVAGLLAQAQSGAYA